MAYFDKYGVEFSDDRKILVHCPEEFQGEYVIPESVTAIGDNAFSQCTKLTSIVIHRTVSRIGGAAFYGCSSLSSIEIPNTISEIDFYTFYNCESLSSIIIPNGVTRIGGYAFEGCVGLKNVTIPHGVTRIESCAFRGCLSLNSIIIPNSVTHIEEWVFADCGLTSIVVEEGNKYYDSRDNCNAIIDSIRNILIAGSSRTKIPDSIKEIGEYAFSGRSDLTSITIPNNITHIGNEAFADCGLTSIVVEEGNKYYDSRDNCNAIIDSARNILITGSSRTKIPDGITEIGGRAFSDCVELKSITIPDNVTHIWDYAFVGCTGLKAITMPSGITRIGWGTFNGCTSIVSITLPNNISRIEFCAFYGCTSLSSIIIPEGVKSIGDSAFEGCIGLRSIVLPKSLIAVQEQAFLNCDTLKEVFVPLGQKNRFAQMEGLKDIVDKIVERDNEELTILLSIAKAYEKGIVLQQSFPQALVTYIQAAEKGSAEAAYHLGEWYLVGKNVPVDLQKALSYFQQAAKSGYLDAQNQAKKIPTIIEEQEAKERRLMEAERRKTEEMPTMPKLTLSPQKNVSLNSNEEVFYKYLNK